MGHTVWCLDQRQQDHWELARNSGSLWISPESETPGWGWGAVPSICVLTTLLVNLILAQVWKPIAVVPNLFGTGDLFCGRQFSTDRSWGEGWFGNDSSDYIYCVLYFYYALYFYWASLVVQMVKNLPAMQETWATHSSILAWRIPWTEEPGGLQSMGVAKSRTWLSDWHFHFVSIIMSAPPQIIRH